MKKGTVLYGMICMLVGAALGGGGFSYAAGVLAERSTNEVYVNGQRVELDAYAIDGHNYVKLRDVGKAVNFNVYWDGAVKIDSDFPYTGEAPVTEIVPAVTETLDYSTQANPVIFTGVYTREAFNALRECIDTGAPTSVSMSQEIRAAMYKVEAAIGTYPGYDFTRRSDGLIEISRRYPMAYTEAAKVCKMYIDTLKWKTDLEKLNAFACLVCDHLEYEAKSTTTPDDLFTKAGRQKGNCMSYAHGFKFLCDLAGIPCIYVHSSTHQWNEVYVNGFWECVDLTSFRIGYEERGADHVIIDRMNFQGETLVQTEPWLTQYAKEVLVPGSTK